MPHHYNFRDAWRNTHGRHPDGSSWNPNDDRGEGQYSDYPADDPRAPRGDPSLGGDDHCTDCGKKFQKGDEKYTPFGRAVGSGGSLCKNCYHDRFGKFQMGDDRYPRGTGRKRSPPDDDDPHDFFPFPRQGGSPPPTAGAAAVRKRKVVYY